MRAGAVYYYCISFCFASLRPSVLEKHSASLLAFLDVVVGSQKALSGWFGLEANLASHALELFVALARDPAASFVGLDY
ncbi:hypothetical protein A2U01_0083033, partial [Trifolium medium]|nr:hypothetical protein [Trifolium medium]